MADRLVRRPSKVQMHVSGGGGEKCVVFFCDPVPGSFVPVLLVLPD